MNNRLKAGIISGLIAGIVGGISLIFVAIYLINNGLFYFDLGTLPIIPIKQIVATEITINIIWGIILGIIYSKIYDVIPGKGITKGLTVGLIYVLIYNIRWILFSTIYSMPHTFFHQIVTFILIGLVLGISYEFLSKKYITRKEKVAVIKYDLIGGIYPGAIAGIVSGLSSFFFLSVAIINPLLWPKLVADIGFLMSQLGSIVFFCMTCGIIFGILFAMFYERIPKKGILKALIFSMVIFFFSNLQLIMRQFIYPYNDMYALWGLLAALFVFVPLSIVLGLLYRTPVEVTAIKEKPTKGICRYCGTKIHRESKFCRECGKKQ